MGYEAVGPEGSAESGGGKLPSFKVVAGAVLVAAVVIFFLQNGESSQVEFLWFDVNWPLRTVIGLSVVAGVVLDRLFVWQWRRARKRKSERSASD